MSRLPTLTPDDPLRTAVASPTPASGRTDTSGPPIAAGSEPPASPRSASTPVPADHVSRDGSSTATDRAAQVDEEWSGTTDVTTARMPTEILRLMRRRSRDLGLPIGMLLTAGLVEILAEDDETLTGRIETTQLRYDRARRRASRAA